MTDEEFFVATGVSRKRSPRAAAMAQRLLDAGASLSTRGVWFLNGVRLDANLDWAVFYLDNPDLLRFDVDSPEFLNALRERFQNGN